MNKKGGLLLGEETLKIVIAVIAIGFLVYFLVSIYFANKNTAELEQAEASLNFLMNGIAAGRTSIDIYNPEGWNIGTWPHDVDILVPFKDGSRVEGTAAEYPSTCDDNGWANCICICKEDNANSCDTNGICVNNNNDFNVEDGNIKIDNPPITLSIDYTNKKISK